jgi:hypothetical protein
MLFFGNKKKKKDPKEKPEKDEEPEEMEEVEDVDEDTKVDPKADTAIMETPYPWNGKHEHEETKQRVFEKSEEVDKKLQQLREKLKKRKKK